MNNTILVIEDDRFLNKIYQVKLSDNGYAVESLFTGVDAVKKIKDVAPDAVLLDIVMPEKDGFRVLQEITEHTAELPKVPVIVLTNLSQEEDLKRLKELGAHTCLVKSEISFMEVIDIVRNCIESGT